MSELQGAAETPTAAAPSTAAEPSSGPPAAMAVEVGAIDSWTPMPPDETEQPGTAPAPVVAPAVVPSREQADARSERWRRPQLRASVTILLFVLGVVGGVVGFRALTSQPAQPPASDSFPALDRAAVEPAPAATVASEIAAGDIPGLAQTLDKDTLALIQNQIQPLVSVETVKFVGATSKGTDTIAGYVVRGRTGDGQLALVGLILRVRDGQVVAQ